jgi:hypothetical protein
MIPFYYFEHLFAWDFLFDGNPWVLALLARH